MQDLPPKVEQIVIEQPTPQNRSEPHVVFLPHNLSRRMARQLEKEQKTIHKFMADMCMKYLDDLEKEQQDLEKAINFSEMQLFEPKL